MSSQGVVPPVGRPRSNALSGPKDPRRPDTQKLFDLQLKSAKPVADSLRSFLLKIYSNTAIMQATDTQKWPVGLNGKPMSPESDEMGETLADRIYDLYTAVTKAPSGRTEEEMRIILKDIRSLKSQYPAALHGIQAQNYRLDIRQILKYKGGDFVTLCNDFIFFFPPTQTREVIRVYANAKYDRILDVIAALLSYIQSNPGTHGIANFKIAGPATPKRSDTMVIYTGGTEAADTVANLLLQSPDCFDMAVPEMTSRKHGRIGISTGAEPKWQPTGLGRHLGKNFESNELRKEHGVGGAAYAPQSFGTIRCQAIAAAILNFQMNLDQVPNTFEQFCRFVSVAFTGLGLDPANPGD